MPETISEFSVRKSNVWYHGFLSNFFVEPDETTVEHEYQAAKTLDLAEKVKILTAKTPSQAKRLGRKVKLRPDWEEQKYEIMRNLVLMKFMDHSGLARSLVDTGDAYLIEGNTWHDNIWGICRCATCEKQQRQGSNYLGLILMEVRDLINSYYLEENNEAE